MDNIKTWTGLPMEESVRMTEDMINGEMVWPTLGQRTGQNKSHATEVTFVGRNGQTGRSSAINNALSDTVN